jgi:hypothetical protein
MSALGQTRLFRDVRGMSGLTPTADILGPVGTSHLWPLAEIHALISASPIALPFVRGISGVVQLTREQGRLAAVWRWMCSARALEIPRRSISLSAFQRGEGP